MSIIDEWTGDLREVLAAEPSTAAEVRIGIFYTGVRLTSGEVGVAFSPRDMSDTVCCPRSAASAPPAGRLAGQDAWSLAAYAASDAPLDRAVGVASLNALSARALGRGTPRGCNVIAGQDALDAAGVVPSDRVVLVGAFTPFLKILKGNVADLRVVDKHPAALREDEASLWRSPAQALETIADASVVIISGSALVEGGLDSLLEAAAGARQVVLAGPTASPWPPTFFARGVDVIGGVRITAGEKAMQVVSEGGSGYVLFSDVGEKVTISRTD